MEKFRLRFHLIQPAYIQPNENVRLSCTRSYLERAIFAYEEAGGTYKPGKAEQRAAAFDMSIPKIKKITFKIEARFSGQTWVVTLTDDQVQIQKESFPNGEKGDFDGEMEEPLTKDEFLERLRDIHIGEWKKHYDAADYDIIVMDGTEWDLTIEYTEGRKTKYEGNNAYPFSFDEFCNLIGFHDSKKY